MEEERENGAAFSTAKIIAKCINANCGWEARDVTEILSDDIGNIFCPICGRVMQEVSE